MVLTASSIRSVTSVSIVSGSAPGSTVVIVTIGKSIFGNRSMPRPLYATAPKTTRAEMTMVVSTGCRIDVFEIHMAASAFHLHAVAGLQRLGAFNHDLVARAQP